MASTVRAAVPGLAPAPTAPPLLLQRSALLLGPAALVAASAVAVAGGPRSAASTPPATWTVVAAVVAVVLGVPHGAVDHLTLSEPRHGRRRAAVAAAYLALAAAGAAAVLLAPVSAFVGVVALSVWHFGAGDVEALTDAGAPPPPSRADRLLHVAAVGAAPVLLPLTSPSGAAALAALEPSLAVLSSHPLVPVVRAAALALALGCLLRLVVRRSWRACSELAVLVVAGLVLPAFLAFALYFAAWHATRHTVRLALDDAGRLDRDRLRLVLRDGLPSFLVAAALVGAAAAAGLPPAEALWVSLAAVWGLTVPHTAAVTAFDLRRRAARAAASA